MPRSSHGRVLHQSRRLKAAIGGDSPNNQIQMTQTQTNKNYILCHVRKVHGKGEDEDDDGVGQSQKFAPTSKIPNKLKQTGHPQNSDNTSMNKHIIDLSGFNNRKPLDPNQSMNGLSAYKQKKLLQ